MKSKIIKFLGMLSFIILIIPFSSVNSLKFKIGINEELGRTRIILKEICFAKPPEAILFWSSLVDDKDIFALNNMVINIPAKSLAIKAIKNLIDMRRIPTDYIEDHYYEMLDREDHYNNMVYKCLRNHKIVKRFLNLTSKDNVDQTPPLAKRRKICT